ncbi:MAG: universal stress protein, partial [Microlunatus sp.]|nr:universal stress protein [Microlunatus sp.]
SGQSRAAVRWAAGEAVRRHLQLRLVHAYWMPNALSLPGLLPATFDDESRDWSEKLLGEAAAQIAAEFPDLRITTAAIREAPGEGLRDASADASLTVIGATGHGEFASTVLGSVAMYLTRYADGPVVVVRGDRPELSFDDGPVLVCIDGTMESDDLLTFAFEQAGSRTVPWLAVHTFNDDVPDRLAWPYAAEIRKSRAAEERSYLDGRLADCIQKYADVDATPVVLAGRPAAAILRYVKGLPYAEQPCLIVTGSRGLSGVSGMIFGSTSHTLMTHARCPVAVIPNTRA